MAIEGLEAENREIALRLGRLFASARRNRGMGVPQVEVEMRQRFGASTPSASSIQRLEWGGIEKPAWADVLRLAAFYEIPLHQLVEITGIPIAGETVTPTSTRQWELRRIIDEILKVADDEQLVYPVVLNRGLLEQFTKDARSG